MLFLDKTSSLKAPPISYITFSWLFVFKFIFHDTQIILSVGVISIGEFNLAANGPAIKASANLSDLATNTASKSLLV